MSQTFVNLRTYFWLWHSSRDGGSTCQPLEVNMPLNPWSYLSKSQLLQPWNGYRWDETSDQQWVGGTQKCQGIAGKSTAMRCQDISINRCHVLCEVLPMYFVPCCSFVVGWCCWLSRFSSCAMSREHDLDEPRNKRARLSGEGTRWRNKTIRNHFFKIYSYYSLGQNTFCGVHLFVLPRVLHGFLAWGSLSLHIFHGQKSA